MAEAVAITMSITATTLRPAGRLQVLQTPVLLPRPTADSVEAEATTARRRATTTEEARSPTEEEEAATTAATDGPTRGTAARPTATRTATITTTTIITTEVQA